MAIFIGEYMKDYKIFWHEKVKDEDQNLLFLSERSVVIAAENPDAAINQWSKEYDRDELNPIELEEIQCVVEHEIFNNAVVVTMPNGYTYLIPVEVVARKRSLEMTGGETDEVAEHLHKDTIPLFVSDQNQILVWAKKIPWFDIENDRHVVKTNKKITMNTLQDFWVKNKHSLEPVFK